MAGIIVEVAADIGQYLKGMATAAKSTSTLDVQVNELNVDTKKLAETQVRASVKASERLRSQVVVYKQIAASAQKGSREQVAAARLAADAERKLASSLGAVEHETRRMGSSTRGLERDLSHAARGAASGSGLFRGFGRSLAFASGGFLAFHEASDFIRESINAAREAVVSQRSLAAQMKASGESFEQNRERIEKVSLSYGKFGFQNDEVIASLTVLERGTGKINKAIALQGLTANLARAKNLDLAKAANVVAKVFGGQETALRRAVPGLQKNAHGMDLIRAAQAKLAGQAAANTTAADRFAATLHNTEEIVGAVLLPTLNKYLESLSEWLTRMNESGKLQRDVATATHVLSDAIGILKGAFDILNTVTGSTKRSLELLLGLFAAYKALKIGQTILGFVDALRKVGPAAEESASGVGKLGKALTLLRTSGLLGPAGVIAAGGVALLYMEKKAIAAAEAVDKIKMATFEKGSGLETTLVPNLAKQIEALRKAGDTSAEIITKLRARLGGSLKADDLIAEAFAFSSGSDPKLQARIRAQVRKRIDDASKTVGDEVEKASKGPTVKQRQTWFDNFIQRSLFRIDSDAPLQAQLATLQHIDELIGKRIGKTKDITRKLKLEDDQLNVIRQERQIRAQLADQALAGLQLGVTKAGLTETLSDDLAALDRVAAFLERRIAVVKNVGKKLDLENQLLGVIGQVRQAKQQMFQNMIDALQFNVDKAGVTAAVVDDIAALRALDAALAAREKVVGKTLDLERQRFEVRQQILGKLQEKRTAAQFRQLGFGPTGEDLIPTGRQLLKKLGKLQDAVKGTVLDTAENRKLLARIRRTLVDGLGKLAPEVRQKVQELLDALDVDNAAKKKRGKRKTPLEEFTGLGSVISSGLTHQGLPVGVPLPKIWQRMMHDPTMLPGALRPATITINGGLHVHGVQNVRQLENELVKRRKSRPHPRRGS